MHWPAQRVAQQPGLRYLQGEVLVDVGILLSKLRSDARQIGIRLGHGHPGLQSAYIPGIVILAFIKPSIALDLLLVLNRYPKLWREKGLRAVEVPGRYPDNGIG